MRAEDMLPVSGARGHLGEVAGLFLKLGCIAFGGPAAHIALMRDEIVRRRRWVDDERFMDLLGITNLIPGPNSTEMAIHLGYVRAGWTGLIVAGALFIIPAALSVTALAWAYTTFGMLPQAGWLLYGIKPVIIAIIVHALWGLGKAALKIGANSPRPDTLLQVAVSICALALYLLGVNEIALLFGGGALVLLIRNAAMVRPFRLSALVLPGLGMAESARGGRPMLADGWLTIPMVAGAAVATYSPVVLFLTFLKIGAVLYGSGYVLLAFLRADFVERLGWLTDAQLMDAVAVGQFTPGPVFTTATFVGYLVGGAPGAALATVGIFLPAFVFVALSNPFISKMRGSPPLSALLDGVNASALGLMAAVAYQLGRVALVDLLTVVLAVAALVLLVRTRINSAWLVLGSGVIGVAAGMAGG